MTSKEQRTYRSKVWQLEVAVEDLENVAPHRFLDAYTELHPLLIKSKQTINFKKIDHRPTCPASTLLK